jgi:ketosteroid isomerase-like protein
MTFQTNANGKSTHGFPFLNEYIFTFTFEGDKLLSVDEFVDPKIIFELINNETIAAAAELNC